MRSVNTAARIVDAARECLLADGYTALSTRKVAEKARVPLSQIHYHFGKKEQLVLSLLQAENARLVERQASMFAEDLPVWQQWKIACDYLDEDIDSGYVRVLQEMMTAGWSSPGVLLEVKKMLDDWSEMLTGFARRMEPRGVSVPGLTTEEVAALISAVFLGAETLVLNGQENKKVPIRMALRSIGRLMAAAEGATP